MAATVPDHAALIVPRRLARAAAAATGGLIGRVWHGLPGRDSTGRKPAPDSNPPGWIKLTFAELERQSNRFANGLEAVGITRGTRVVVMVRPGLDFIGLVFALFKIGAVPVMIDPGMGMRRMVGCIEKSRPQAFIGIPLAQVLRLLHRRRFGEIRTVVTVGRRLGWGGATLDELAAGASDDYEMAPTRADEPAAILFTTGSTGPPKGVEYEHGMFHAQVEAIRDHYGIEAGEVDLPAFPLFALFSTAMGMTCVIPDMDPSHPARVDPRQIVEPIIEHRVTSTFGSPAIWRKVGRYCVERGIRLATLRRVLTAGAPIPWQVLEDMRRVLPDGAQLHTPYGATESLPVASIGSDELLGFPGRASTPSEPRASARANSPVKHDVHLDRRQRAESLSQMARRGCGTCVGRPDMSTTVRIIRISDEPIEPASRGHGAPCDAGDSARAEARGSLAGRSTDPGRGGHGAGSRAADIIAALEVPRGERGEIVVSGPVVTKRYFGDEAATRLHKIYDGDTVWHRIGDVGYFDDEGRLWFCGRKAHRVETADGPLYTIECEAVFNEHPDVFRSALVGVGPRGSQTPVIIVEPVPGQFPSRGRRGGFVAELLKLGAADPRTARIRQVLFHRSFPVDIRHNAKIFREKLAVWAAGRVGDR